MPSLKEIDNDYKVLLEVLFRTVDSMGGVKLNTEMKWYKSADDLAAKLFKGLSGSPNS